MGHHVVPQRYLKGFQTKENDDFIWMYDKKEKTVKYLPIKQVAQIPRFYGNDVEAALNKEVEQPGNDVIDKLRQGEAPDEKDRRDLTYYIATMIARVPAARARANTFVPEALAGVTADVKAAIEEAHNLGLINDQMKAARMAEAEAVHQRFQKQAPVQIKKVIESPWPFERWLVAIYNMTWRVIESNGPSYYLTSDNPTTLLLGSGLADEWCELTFPLSKDLMLHCS